MGNETKQAQVGDFVRWKHWADKDRIQEGTVVKIHETGVIEMSAKGRPRRIDFCKPSEVIQVIPAPQPVPAPLSPARMEIKDHPDFKRCDSCKRLTVPTKEHRCPYCNSRSLSTPYRESLSPARTGEGEPEKLPDILVAAKHADWMQVVLNQGPPCFRVDDDGTFCFRAQRWAGHDSSHAYVSLHDLLAVEQLKREQAVKAAFASGKAAGGSR